MKIIVISLLFVIQFSQKARDVFLLNIQSRHKLHTYRIGNRKLKTFKKTYLTRGISEFS
jgi:hypothetical protein